MNRESLVCYRKMKELFMIRNSVFDKFKEPDSNEED